MIFGSMGRIRIDDKTVAQAAPAGLIESVFILVKSW